MAHWQIVFGTLTKVFPFAIVTYCVQQTGVYAGGPAGVYTGGPNTGGPNGPAGACPATARPARPNWPKAAAALALAASSTAFADPKVKGMALSAISPILNIAGPRVFIVLPDAPIRNRHAPKTRTGSAHLHGTLWYYTRMLKRPTHLVRSWRLSAAPADAPWVRSGIARPFPSVLHQWNAPAAKW
jgi:hypothetical protein